MVSSHHHSPPAVERNPTCVRGAARVRNRNCAHSTSGSHPSAPSRVSITTERSHLDLGWFT
jgi:hypothetical protein